MWQGASVAMIGEKFGHYRVTAKIGEGGMGTVYLAEHPDIGRKVAVKVLRPEYWDNAESLERLFREAQSTATMRHPILVDVIDFGVHATLHCAYVVMEYLEGESLENRITRAGKLPMAMAVEFSRQIAIGAGFAHRAGIIHRDLKPANVFIVPDLTRPGAELIKILDFGIAKVTNPALLRGQATRTDAIIGTPLYMAPEQCRGAGKVDFRTDVYALGCIMYEMLCGRPPFAYTWPGELIAAHLAEPLTPPRMHNPAIPEPLDGIVCKLLAKDPAARYQTMTEVSDDLDRLLSLHASGVPAAGWSWSVMPGSASGSQVPPANVFASPPAQPPMQAAMTPNGVRPSGGGLMAVGSGVAPPVGGLLLPPDFQPRPGGVTPAQKLMATSPLTPPRNTTLSKGTSEVESSRTRSGSTSRNRIVIASTLGVALLLGVAGTVVALYPARPTPTHAASGADSSAMSAHEPSVGPSAAPNDPAQASAEPGEVAAPPASSSAEPTEDPNAPLAAGIAAAGSLSTPEAAASTRPPRTEPAVRPPRVDGDIVRISVANPRPGVAVALDGHAMSLPLRLPRDHQPHALTFSAPRCRPETITVRADKDIALTLQYRPTLYVP